jgi:hypothetical protein
MIVRHFVTSCVCLSVFILGTLNPAYALAQDCADVVYLNDFEAAPPDCPKVPEFSYKLSQSTGSVEVKTAPVTFKQTGTVFPVRSGLRLSAARREFEPVQLLISPVGGATTASASIAPFPNLGAGQRVELAIASYEANGWPEDLDTIANNEVFPMQAARDSRLWITVYVPPDAPAGQHFTTLSLSVQGQSVINIPVELYVFDFSLPADISFKSQFNIAIQDPQHDFKQLLYEHHLTPGAVTYPSSYRPTITWDSVSNPNRCEQFWDEANESALYGIWTLGPKYILGEGWNGAGFPDTELFKYTSNSVPRPATFCDEAIGSNTGTAAYNTEWSAFLTGLQNYLQPRGMLPKSFYFVMNEPVTTGDFDLANHLCRLSRNAAPNLRLAISEEPKPQIAEHAAGACGYDIWIANARRYGRKHAWQRQTSSNEEVWLYHLTSDNQPFMNPRFIERDGLEVRALPWAAWVHRISGWAIEDGGSFFNGAEPGIRAKLLREGFEDYEYLMLLNGGQYPEPNNTNPADAPAFSVAKTFNSWTSDADALMKLRFRLGLYLEGKSTEIATIVKQSSNRPRGEYYINFQDPANASIPSPMIVDGKTYTPVGWQFYQPGISPYMGWTGGNLTNAGALLYGYQPAAVNSTEIEKSYLFHDFGFLTKFEMELENGSYQVTVGVNRPSGSADPHNLVIEGIRVFDDEVLPGKEARTQLIHLQDGSLTLEVGGWSATAEAYAYTFLAYMKIVPVP